ncbi:MAG: BatA domain-containing protein [Verrucomicrobia bacterium]|nr:BatA domain-containing protein [Verrucomicrobiota bacterium]
MTFLQPFVLLGLPLVLLPVLIHLINRMRHRPQPWAAMQFLLTASRSSVNQQKLRQFLILLFRVLALCALILFLSRPLAGGWVGWVFASAPDAILILLDRSASMEERIPGGTATKREQAIRLLADAAEKFSGRSHLVVIENALGEPQEIARGENLKELSLTAATDTAADLPAMFQTALDWLIENRAGTAELWIASDLQRSNWNPTDSRWNTVVTQFSSLPQTVRVRLLTFDSAHDANVSVSLKEITRRSSGGQSAVKFVLDLQQRSEKSEAHPMTITLDGARSQVDVMMESQMLRWRHAMSIGAKQSGGWGIFEWPADGNPRDNRAYFVYSPEVALKAAVVSTNRASARAFQLASSTVNNSVREAAVLIDPRDFKLASCQDKTLIVWHAPLPEGPAAQTLRTFIEEGGRVVFFPVGIIEPQRFIGLTWNEAQTTSDENAFRVTRWEEEEGPLAKTDEGLSLALPDVDFFRRQTIQGEKNVLATFTDGSAFLTRTALGRGEMFFCASVPDNQWSSLADGYVLVPMLQRLLHEGSRRLIPVSSYECGEMPRNELAAEWRSVDSESSKEIAFEAGVYQAGDRLVAMNRPAAEDDLELVSATEAEKLFGTLPFQMFQEGRRRTDRLQGEFWRFFVFGMLLFLLVEGALILPPKSANPQHGAARSSGAPVIVAAQGTNA